MTYWIGLLTIAVGGWLLISARIHRARASTRQALESHRDAGAGETHPSLAFVGSVFPPFIIAGLAFTGLKTIAAYVMLDGGAVFSLFDLAGFLFLLAAFAYWLVIKTRAWRHAPAKPPEPASQLDRI